MRYDVVNQRVHDAKDQNARAMERLSSQKEIRKLSDNPIGATQMIRFRDGISDLQQFQTNIEYSKGFIERSEASLQSITDNLIRAKELAVGMSNDTYDKNSREATSREIRELMDEVVQIANTTFNGRYIFGGFRNQTPPVTIEGDYVGDDGAIFVQMSPGNFRQMNLNARNIFEASPDDRALGHMNMVQCLANLYEGLQANDKTMIHASLSELDHQLEKTSSSHATLGAMENSLKDTGDRLASEEVLMKSRLSKVQDTDIYDATSEFKRTEVVLQGTLTASTKLLQPSLLNFLQ
jgi:flagellar hook-associated protein 3 FlgL